MKLISELKRRNVFRMAVLYLAASWLVLQVVDLLIDRGPLPESLGPLTLAVLAIGFPKVLARESSVATRLREIDAEAKTAGEEVWAYIVEHELQL